MNVSWPVTDISVSLHESYKKNRGLLMRRCHPYVTGDTGLNAFPIY